MARPKGAVKIPVKANEHIFNRWRRLAYKIDQSNALVQNDIETDVFEVQEWKAGVEKLQVELKELLEDTTRYILKGQTK